MRVRRRAILGATAAVLLIVATAAFASLGRGFARFPQALWQVVHLACVPNARVTGLPFPCTAANLRAGYVVVNDTGPTGYLLVPTRRLTGIEDKRVLGPGAPDPWRAAWEVRRFTEAALRRSLPREDLGLALNGKLGRTQHQFHIHVDCVREDVRATLAAEPPMTSRSWRPLVLRSHPYFVRAIAERDLAAPGVFGMVAHDGPTGTTRLADQTIALLGRADASGGEPGFFLITATADTLNRGHAEELLDHGCAVAHPPLRHAEATSKGPHRKSHLPPTR